MVQETVAEDPQVNESAPLLGGAKRLRTTTYTVRTLPLALIYPLGTEFTN